MVSVLDGVPLHGTVVAALRSAARVTGGRPVDTRDVLVALMRADASGEWHRVWLYCGNDDAIAALSVEDPACDAVGTWESIPLTGACAIALEASGRLSRRYDLRPVPTGVLALGLVADERSAASRALGRAGLGRQDLVELLQQAVLGTSLRGLDNALPQVLAEARQALGPRPVAPQTPRAAAPAPAAVAASAPAPPPRNPPACPRHGDDHLVRSVSSVYSEGTAVSHSWGPVVGMAGGHLVTGVSRHSGTVRTDLARRLSPRPDLKPAGGLGCVGTMILLIGGVLVLFGQDANRTFHDGSGDGPVSFGVELIVLSACVWIPAMVRSARRSRVERGLPKAVAVWQAGLYCGRCDGVFFPLGTERPEVDPGELISTDVFRSVVWTAGGYGDLATPVGATSRPSDRSRDGRTSTG